MPDDKQDRDDEIVHYERGIPIFNTRLNDLENKAREAETRDNEYKKEQIRLNRRLVWFTGVLAVCSLISGGISYWQTHIAKITADAARDNAAAARDNAAAAKAQSETAYKSLINAREQFINEQRPIIWLTGDFGSPTYVPLAKQVIWEWRFTNYGKTPAQDVSFAELSMKIGENGKWVSSYLGENPNPPRQISTPIAPREDVRRTAVSPPGISQSEFDRLLTISYSISLRGSMSYTDAYHGRYETRFCITRLNAGGITFCEGNWIK